MTTEPEQDFVITLKDVRVAKLCSAGAREWFRHHKLDWMDFLKNGIPASKLLATNDELGKKLVESTRKNKNGQQ